MERAKVNKKRINGKCKGSSFERSICKKLSLWITNGEKDDCFWRSAISGGRATVAHKAGRTNRQAGDICSVSPEGHRLTDVFFIECKHVKDLQIDKFILFNTGVLAKFWEVCIKQAKAHNRLPVIIAKQNGMAEIVVTQANALYYLHSETIEQPLTLNPEIRLLSNLLNHKLEKN